MELFCKTYCRDEFVSALPTQISWTNHFHCHLVIAIEKKVIGKYEQNERQAGVWT